MDERMNVHMNFIEPKFSDRIFHVCKNVKSWIATYFIFSFELFTICCCCCWMHEISLKCKILFDFGNFHHRLHSKNCWIFQSAFFSFIHSPFRINLVELINSLLVVFISFRFNTPSIENGCNMPVIMLPYVIVIFIRFYTFKR